jgi:hypothetical protein
MEGFYLTEWIPFAKISTVFKVLIIGFERDICPAEKKGGDRL